MSLVLVSGFLGNPASSFGHALLKLNSTRKTQDIHYFDKTINYGAQVPEDEPILRYVFSGIFGRYVGRFTDEYFFTQDRVYTRTEFRDMWEYALQLDATQLEFLLLHVWEIRGFQFKYLFFEKNCAYRIAQLIDLVAGTRLVAGVRPWYLPEQPFQVLGDAFSSQGKPLVKSVEFIPSSQRVLYAQLSALSEQEREWVKLVVEDVSADSLLRQGFGQLAAQSQITILDALLAYVKYKKVALGGEQLVWIQRLEHAILLRRLELPASPPFKGEVPVLRSPEKGNKPSFLSISAYQDEVDLGVTYEIGAFKRDMHTRNSLEGNTLNILNMEWAQIGTVSRLEALWAMEARNLKPVRYDFARDKNWSWQVALGGERPVEGDFQFLFNFGFGESMYLGEKTFAYALANTNLYHASDFISVGVLTGWMYQGRSVNIQLENEFKISHQGKHGHHFKAHISMPLSRSVNWITQFERQVFSRVKTGISFHF